MLTARENMQRTFDGKPAEWIGVMDSMWSDTLRKWSEQGYPTRRVRSTVKMTVKENGADVEKEAEQEEDAPVPPDERFGFDMMDVGGWFDMMPLKGVNELVEESDEWVIRRNGAGASLKYWKNKSGTPEHVDFRMTSREVWERDYRPHLLGVDPARLNIEHARKRLELARTLGRWSFMGHLFIWENMRRSMGDVCMYESLITDPEWIHDYNRVHTDMYIAHYKLLFEQAGLPDGVWMYEDLGYNKGLFCSPKVLAELIFPYFREVVDFFHTYGLKVVLHSCGSQREALPLIVECGFDGLNPMEVAAGNDIFEYAEKYGDKLVFVGGFDKRLLETHDHDLIRREVAKFMNGMKERGARFVFASDHSISTNVHYADYLCAFQAYQEHKAL
ncbi:MAG TPA: uroporphyrinogen decarboxylase family protein [Candidatus Brocadiia bacterium]|nr:uroporphyrinogen decarboxylase family protein [Candidatus Brocadiia bacterium]